MRLLFAKYFDDPLAASGIGLSFIDEIVEAGVFHTENIEFYASLEAVSWPEHWSLRATLQRSSVSGGRTDKGDARDNGGGASGWRGCTIGCGDDFFSALVRGTFWHSREVALLFSAQFLPLGMKLSSLELS